MQSAKKPNNFLFKALITGDSEVGKTNIMTRFADDQFNPKFNTTIGVDFKAKIIEQNGNKSKLKIWDTAGKKRFKAIRSQYYGACSCVIVVYDITCKKSFDHVKDWVSDIKKMGVKML